MATEKFHYTHDGTEITLPKLGQIRAGVLRKIRKLKVDDQLFTLLEELADEQALAVVDDMDVEQLGAFLEAWQEASGVSLGESTASSTS